MPPIVKGALLTVEPERVHAQLRAMIIENGASQMISWVNGLEGMLMQGNSPTLANEQKKYGTGDVSGAPDPRVNLKQRVVAEFARSRDRWRALTAYAAAVTVASLKWNCKISSSAPPATLNDG